MMTVNEFELKSMIFLRDERLSNMISEEIEGFPTVLVKGNTLFGDSNNNGVNKKISASLEEKEFKYMFSVNDSNSGDELIKTITYTKNYLDSSYSNLTETAVSVSGGVKRYRETITRINSFGYDSTKMIINSIGDTYISILTMLREKNAIYVRHDVSEDNKYSTKYYICDISDNSDKKIALGDLKESNKSEYDKVLERKRK